MSTNAVDTPNISAYTPPVQDTLQPVNSTLTKAVLIFCIAMVSGLATEGIQKLSELNTQPISDLLPSSFSDHAPILLGTALTVAGLAATLLMVSCCCRRPQIEAQKSQPLIPIAGEKSKAIIKLDETNSLTTDEIQQAIERIIDTLSKINNHHHGLVTRQLELYQTDRNAWGNFKETKLEPYAEYAKKTRVDLENLRKGLETASDFGYYDAVNDRSATDLKFEVITNRLEKIDREIAERSAN